ncbi:peptidoglycan DD-metalloendopeptidase family protein [Novispirillum itersonii]|uniref:Murein DD-endopeptidase MepM/ murein hydrolase activator NlpD n=1 Tax=Novispirillum itersonii TaxID=189 RepID=A0A7X0DLI2_NOVIT|nr:peptidoglycan DD-metalloendopeptidase family protein [Novispirillum itersonii]MBB6210030.1 murein DD-endopeptidase MepM/ murein hydrolase activator NlpD [Novispirillum itersonii]
MTVGKGETLPSLARRLDIPSRFLIAENDLKSPYTLSEGQVLKVPAIRSHTVVSGETLTGISNRYGVDMTQLARINDIPAPYGVKVGQVLGIPQNEPKQPLPAAARDMAPVGQPPAATPAPATEPQAQPAQPQPAAQTGSTVPAKADMSVEPPKRAGSLFAWPIKGKVLTGFGVDAAGLRNDGINIQASPGSSVRAAENGVVVYAGNELKGFGNLLLIKHADGWMTAYAHNAELAVLRGDIVKKGQVIAKAGATGSVTSPQVHFEVRKDGAAVDPTQYMEKR